MDKTICVFGDSITQAAYVTIGWVEVFRKYLEEKYPNHFMKVFNMGIAGNTTDDLLNRFEKEASVRTPTSIIFQIGTNDSGYYREITKPITTEGNFLDNLTKLVELAKKFTSDVSFLGLTIGDDSLTQPLPESLKGKCYTKERVEKYDELLKTSVEKKGVKYIALRSKLDYQDFSDGLHPNDEGHQKIFDQVKNFF